MRTMPVSVALCALLAVLCSACGSDDQAPASDGPEVKVTDPAKSRTKIRRLGTEALTSLTATDGHLSIYQPRLKGPAGAWTSCDDNDDEVWAYEATSRIDLKPGSPGLETLPDVRNVLENNGWTYEPDPVAEDTDVSVSARKDALFLTVRGYPDKDFLLFELDGPCLEVAKDQREAISDKAYRSDRLAIDPRGPDKRKEQP